MSTGPWYLLAQTVEKYRWIGPVQDENHWERRLIRVRTDPVEGWVAVPVEWLPETRKRLTCDFPTFWTSILCVSRRGLAAVGDMLRESGEFLPLSGLDDEYVGFHCLRTIDAVDSTATDMTSSSNPGLAFASPTFVPTLRQSAIEREQVFRVPQSFQKIFVSEAFVERYVAASLTGLSFLRVSIT